MKWNWSFKNCASTCQLKTVFKLNNTLNSLKGLPMNKIAEFYTESFSVYPNITSKFRTISAFKRFVTENDSNITRRDVHGRSMTKLHLTNGATVQGFSPQNKICILTFNRPPCSHFLFFAKLVLLKIVRPLNISEHKTSLAYVDWGKFCIHIRNLNVRHFWMVEATGLEMMASRSPSMTISLLDSKESLPVG
jgi:hypothetical protein